MWYTYTTINDANVEALKRFIKTSKKIINDINDLNRLKTNDKQLFKINNILPHYTKEQLDKYNAKFLSLFTKNNLYFKIVNTINSNPYQRIERKIEYIMLCGVYFSEYNSSITFIYINHLREYNRLILTENLEFEIISKDIFIEITKQFIYEPNTKIKIIPISWNLDEFCVIMNILYRKKYINKAKMISYVNQFKRFASNSDENKIFYLDILKLRELKKTNIFNVAISQEQYELDPIRYDLVDTNNLEYFKKEK